MYFFFFKYIYAAGRKRKHKDDPQSKKCRRSTRDLTEDAFYRKVQETLKIENSAEELDNIENNSKELIVINITKLYNNLQELNRKAISCCIDIGKNIKTLKIVFKQKDKDLDELFKGVTGLSKANRNFFVQLFELSESFSKVKYITMNYSDIKQKFAVLKNRIYLDSAFWK